MKDIINYSLTNISYYKNKYSDLLFDDDAYSKMDILNKDTVRDNLPYFSGSKKYPIISLFTSGTTGLPLSVLWKKNDYFRSFLPVWRMRSKWYNVYPKDKCVTFHLNNKNSSSIMLINDNHISFSRDMIDKYTLVEYCNTIKEFDPVWIQGSASVIYIILKLLDDQKLKLSSLKYIELIEESCTKELKNEIIDLCNVNIAELYASVEFGPIAYECPSHHLHIIDENVNVQSINKELCITTLVNYCMPLIKYNIGDIGNIVDNYGCKYITSGSILNNLLGRSSTLSKINNLRFDVFSINQIIKETQSLGIRVINFHVIIFEDVINLEILVDSHDLIKAKTYNNYLLLNMRKIIPPICSCNIKFTVDEMNFISNKKFELFTYIGE